MSDAMSRSRRNLLIGGAIVLAIPFVAGLMRMSFVQFPREIWVGLTILAMIGAAIGIYVMTRGDREGER